MLVEITAQNILDWKIGPVHMHHSPYLWKCHATCAGGAGRREGETGEERKTSVDVIEKCSFTCLPGSSNLMIYWEIPAALAKCQMTAELCGYLTNFSLLCAAFLQPQPCCMDSYLGSTQRWSSLSLGFVQVFAFFWAESSVIKIISILTACPGGMTQTTGLGVEQMAGSHWSDPGKVNLNTKHPG